MDTKKTKKAHDMKGIKFHRFVYKILSPLVRAFLAPKFNFDFEKVKISQSPYLVISNHVTNWDAVLITSSFKKHMYFVASDQVYRMGFKSKLIKFLTSPIPRIKTINETETVIAIFKSLRAGCSVCLYVEGNTTSDGETLEIHPSIGKLVKRSKVPLVTYRVTGGFFTAPKWARHTHKGKMKGRLVQIYTPEQIALMSEEEIYETVKKDIYVNAYADQEKNRIAYRGKKPAEYLETILYCCPKCKQLSTLTSKDDLFFCVCGYKVRFNEYGYFESTNNEPPVFTTILDWAKWQRKQIALIIDNINDNDTPIITDDEQSLHQATRASHTTFIADGKLSLYKDRLSLTTKMNQTISFPLDSIVELNVFARMRIIFSTDEHNVYEIHCEHPRSAIKYFDAVRTLQSKRST